MPTNDRDKSLTKRRKSRVVRRGTGGHLEEADLPTHEEESGPAPAAAAAAATSAARRGSMSSEGTSSEGTSSEAASPTRAAPDAARPRATTDERAASPRRVRSPSRDRRRTVPGRGGRDIIVETDDDGRITVEAPPPNIEVVSFSGGGGKGAALPGAVEALEVAGVLGGVRKFYGASVGSMTAALLASGATADEFFAIGIDPTVSSKVTDGRSVPWAMVTGGLEGAGLEQLVREKTRQTVLARITEHTSRGGALSAEARVIRDRLEAGRDGPTFGDLRTLSRSIRAIKDLSVTGSFVGEVDPRTNRLLAGQRPQLAIFDADTEPLLEVARAVHASAAFPLAFKPVDIPLSSGIVARFQDGGVFNNAPNTHTLTTRRSLDPVPETGEVTFVFEGGATADLLAGKATPKRGAIKDWLVGAPHAAAEHAMKTRLAERPEDLTVVPLTFEVPASGGRAARTRDRRGLVSGTLAFEQPLEEVLLLQDKAAKHTQTYLWGRQKPRRASFQSRDAALMQLPTADLQVLAGTHEAGAGEALSGAREALEFRTFVTDRADALRAQSLAGAPTADIDRTVGQLLGAEPDGARRERHDYIARAIGRHPELDGVVAGLRARGRAGPTAAAIFDVADGVRARAHATAILDDVVYPHQVKLDPNGAGGQTLAALDGRLRRASTAAEVGAALDAAILHFEHKSDILGRYGHKKFAADLTARRLALGPTVPGGTP